MVFEKLSIDCESIENRNEVFKVLNSIGYKGIGDHDDFLFVQTYEDGDYQTYYEHDSTEQLTYKQFMEKYSNKGGVMNKQLMVSQINTAKEKLNIGDSELSTKLGHHRNYISRVLHQESPSLEQMTKVVKKCNDFILAHSSEELKEEDSLNQKLPCGKPLPEFNPIVIADAKMVSLKELNGLHETIASQDKELEHKNQVLDKRNDLYQKLELECKDKDDAIKLQLENVASKILTINNLESQLKATQEKFIEVVDQKDKEIEKLQNDLNHATSQYQGKRDEVYRLNKKLDEQTITCIIIIAILLIASIIGFAS